MKNKTGIGIGNRAASAVVTAVALLASAGGLLGCVQASAQSAEQAAEVVNRSAANLKQWLPDSPNWTVSRLRSGGFTQAIWLTASPLI